jgi:hypothetical protein
MPGRERAGRLLVDVHSVSGRCYPSGTVVQLAGTASGVDGWAGSEWIPLRWWEFTECDGHPEGGELSAASQDR